MPAMRRFALLATLVAALVSFAPPRPSAAARPILPSTATAPALLPPPVSAGCQVYPVGISQAKLDGAPGSPAPVPLPDPAAAPETIQARYPASVFTVTQAVGNTSFWFATWNGDFSASWLRSSLGGGGTLGEGFTEAFTPSNGLLERGDYAIAHVGNVTSMEAEWSALRDNRIPMALPVIDHFRGTGAFAGMHVARFAIVRLVAWQFAASPRSLTFALVGDDADYACFRHQQRATVGQTVTFTPTMPLTAGLTFGWRFGDGAGSDALTATHAYSATGAFQVTLTVTNARGIAASAHSRIIVDPAPRIDFAATETRIGQATVFHGAVGSLPPPAGIVTGTWDFGDGATAGGYNPTHTYAAVGAYPVTFSVTDRNGFVVSRQRVVEVVGERVWLPLAGRGSALAPPAP